jgi:hypothetical protein
MDKPKNSRTQRQDEKGKPKRQIGHGLEYRHYNGLWHKYLH